MASSNAPRFAPVFVSHGSPMTALNAGPAGAFWHELGQVLSPDGTPPSAVVALSAHTLAREVLVLAAPRHEAVHDFGGFPRALYELRYDAPGAPALADRAVALLQAAGIPARKLEQGGLDHGIWVPLRAIRPEADWPVLPIAFPPDWSPERLFALGQALRPLATDDGAWIMATGSITHNLRLGLPADHPVPEIPSMTEFRAWFAQQAAARDWPRLFAWRAEAPNPAYAHPTDEHLLPWFIAAGAGGPDDFGVRIHASVAGSHLGMDAYAFGPQARCLADRLAEPAAA